MCAVLVSRGEAYCAASQDYETLLFGAQRLVRNLSISGKKKRGNDYVECPACEATGTIEMIQLVELRG